MSANDAAAAAAAAAVTPAAAEDAQPPRSPLDPNRPWVSYEVGSLLRLRKSPLCAPPDGMPELKVWYGEFEQLRRPGRQQGNARDGNDPNGTSYRSNRSYRTEDGSESASYQRKHDGDTFSNGFGGRSRDGGPISPRSGDSAFRRFAPDDSIDGNEGGGRSSESSRRFAPSGKNPFGQVSASGAFKPAGKERDGGDELDADGKKVYGRRDRGGATGRDFSALRDKRRPSATADDDDDLWDTVPPRSPESERRIRNAMADSASDWRRGDTGRAPIGIGRGAAVGPGGARGLREREGRLDDRRRGFASGGQSGSLSSSIGNSSNAFPAWMADDGDTTPAWMNDDDSRDIGDDSGSLEPLSPSRGPNAASSRNRFDFGRGGGRGESAEPSDSHVDSIQAFKAQMKERDRRERESKEAEIEMERRRRAEKNASQAGSLRGAPDEEREASPTVLSAPPGLSDITTHSASSGVGSQGMGLFDSFSNSRNRGGNNNGPASPAREREPSSTGPPPGLGAPPGLSAGNGPSANANNSGTAGAASGRSSRFARLFVDGKPARDPQAAALAAQQRVMGMHDSNAASSPSNEAGDAAQKSADQNALTELFAKAHLESGGAGGGAQHQEHSTSHSRAPSQPQAPPSNAANPSPADMASMQKLMAMLHGGGLPGGMRPPPPPGLNMGGGNDVGGVQRGSPSPGPNAYSQQGGPQHDGPPQGPPGRWMGGTDGGPPHNSGIPHGQPPPPQMSPQLQHLMNVQRGMSGSPGPSPALSPGGGPAPFGRPAFPPGIDPRMMRPGQPQSPAQGHSHGGQPGGMGPGNQQLPPHIAAALAQNGRGPAPPGPPPIPPPGMQQRPAQSPQNSFPPGFNPNNLPPVHQLPPIIQQQLASVPVQHHAAFLARFHRMGAEPPISSPGGGNGGGPPGSGHPHSHNFGMGSPPLQGPPPPHGMMGGPPPGGYNMAPPPPQWNTNPHLQQHQQQQQHHQQLLQQHQSQHQSHNQAANLMAILGSAQHRSGGGN